MPPSGLAHELERLLDTGSGIICPIDPGAPAPVIDQTGVSADFAGVIVLTSGSTGQPKAVMLSVAAMLAAAAATEHRLGAGCWANPLPVWYVAGLMTLVRALVAGRSYWPVEATLEDLPAPDDTAFLSVVPALLHRGLADPAIQAKLAAYSSVLVGGSALDPTVAHQAADAGVRLVATYGMSETCGGVVYDGWPLDSVTVSLAGGSAGQADQGRILISTPTAFNGYLGDPVSTSEVLHGDTVRTADRGRWVDGRLEVVGRVDEVVQSGGVNVDLAAIQTLLDQAFPGLTACFALDDPVWGATVAVASCGPGREAVMASVAPHLSSAARPRVFLTVTDLPRTISGKIDRKVLVEQWRQHGERG